MYYIAVLTTEDINNQVLQWKHYMRDRFGCTVALKSPAHITLLSPFWMNTGLQKSLEDALDAFSQQQKCFVIELHNFDSFKPRVIFVHIKESPEFIHLAESLEKDLAANRLFPVPKPERPIHPHITIANRDLHKSDFPIAWEFFKKKKYEASFAINCLALMKHNGATWEPAHTAMFPFL